MKEKGIPLIALIVTIIILIILAVITINGIFGENGLIKEAERAKEEAEITSIEEKLNIAEGTAYVDGKGTIDPEHYFDILEREEIIVDKEEDVVDNGDGTYEITTEPGYIFEITLLPNKEEASNIEIEYIGKGDKIGPRIKEVRVVEKTTNSVKVEVETKNAEEANYTYLYKKNSEGEESWKEAGKSKENTYTIEGLEAEEIYNIKVKVETKNGSAEEIVNVQMGEIPEGTIKFGEIKWNNNKASITIETIEEGYKLQYQINGVEGEWKEIENKGTITGLNHGDTVYARLWDGTNESDYASASVKDTIAPTVTVTAGTITSSSIGVNVTAKDSESGMGSNVRYTYYIKESTQADSSYVAKITESTENNYTFTGLIQGTSYDIKVEVNGDKAGNKGIGTLLKQTTGTITGVITFGDATWSGGKASITVSANTSSTIQYQKNSTSGTWNNIENNGTITGLSHGDTVYARLWDGTNESDYASANIKDTIAPTVSISTSNVTSKSVTIKVTANDAQSGLVTSGTYEYYLGDELKVANTNSSYEYTGLDSSTTYTLKVIVKDKAGNATSKSTTVTTSGGIEEAKESGEKFTDTTKIKDDLKNEVTIPGGFHVAEDSGTKVEEGIVIEDDAGNQFVWIPVGSYQTSNGSKTNNLTRRSWAGKNVVANPTEVNGDDVIDSSWYGEGDSRSVAKNQIEGFKTSANNNKGYYIGRYEQGVGNVCKAGVDQYTDVTRNEAKTEAEAMYNGNIYITSELISSYAWDTALNFICQTNEEGYLLATTTDSTYGNINTKKQTLSGAYPADKYCNIYDFLGNCQEWTTEYADNPTYFCVNRSGLFSGDSVYGAYRTKSALAGGQRSSVSFRVQLYIK